MGQSAAATVANQLLHDPRQFSDDDLDGFLNVDHLGRSVSGRRSLDRLRPGRHDRAGLQPDGRRALLAAAVWSQMVHASCVAIYARGDGPRSTARLDRNHSHLFRSVSRLPVFRHDQPYANLVLRTWPGISAGRVGVCGPATEATLMPDKASTPSPETRDWRQLLADARGGDEAAIDDLWRSMRTYLLLIAESGLGDGLAAKVDASDIVQNSLLEAQRDFSRFTGDSETELKSWLRQLVKHNLIDVGRHYRQAKSRDVRLEQSLGSDSPVELVDRRQPTASSMIRREEADLELLRAVAQLPSEQRRLVEMRHRRGLTYEEIARELGVSEKTVRNRWAAAIAQLKKDLSGGGESLP
ncbi:hypothetical protein C5Y97_12305 [Blastopirellula marina]|uniref:RNA polymerase sigma factor 70 region 4 type 2 domain-containing protein n=2 Tax=Blastopirellula marina TaxID=124 RepID=A0A2S8FWK3_9BACT|nr:hypothetical protein C5Y98_12295 [Blastopirellula marina]PTL44395.1 hypothetical protein C5Y97_12305 [Blastopirellula marina]